MGSVNSWGELTPALPATTLTLPTIPSTGWKGTVTPTYYKADNSNVYVFCPYELYQSVSNLTWTTQNSGGNTSANPSASTPFPASSVFTGYKAASLNGTSKGPYAYRITNCVKAYIYVKSGSDKKRTITLAAYEVTAGVVSESVAASTTYETNSDGVISINLNSSKEYYVKVSQVSSGSGGSSSGNSTFYMIGFETPSTPATPSFFPANGTVEQDGTINVTSANADDIYYAWTSTESQPANPESWSYVSATSSVGSVPVPSDVTGTYYLYAYGKNDAGSGSVNHASYSIVVPRTETSLAFNTPITTVGVDRSVTNVATLTSGPVSPTITYSSDDTNIATVNASTGEVTGVAVGSTTIRASYAGDESYAGSNASYDITVTQSAVNDKFWNGGDWVSNYAGTYTGSIFIDNMEIKGTASQGVQISSGGEKTIDGHTVAARIRLGKAGSSDGNYLHFKVKPNTKITYWGVRAGDQHMTGGLALSFGTFGTNEQTYNYVGGNEEYMTYIYTGISETDVYAYSKCSGGTSMLAIKVEPMTTGTPTFSPASGESVVPSSTEVTITSEAASTIYYKWTDSSTTPADGWSSASTTDNAITITVPADAEDTPYLHAYGDGTYGESTAAYAQYTITSATVPTISILASKTSNITAGESITLTATKNGLPAPTLKWYVSDTNDTSAGSEISNETDDTYTFNAIAGTKYYYARAFNSEALDGVASNVVTMTAAARTACTLNKVLYSNDFDAFITAPVAEVLYTAEDAEVIAGTKNVGDVKTEAANGKIEAYYMEGTDAPTISSVVVSDGASYDVEGTTFTVTAEDGTSTKVYDITLEDVAPYTGVGEYTFDGTETWVKAPYGFVAESGHKFQRLAKNDEDPWARLSPGYTRIYMFLAPNASVTLTKSGTDRHVDIKRNATVVMSDTGWGNSGSIMITGDSNDPYLLGIYSHQTSGDGFVNTITVTPATVSGTISASGYNTFSSSKPLDLSTIEGGTAYVASGVTNGKVVLTKCNDKIVPAETGLFIAGTKDGTFTISADYSTPTFDGDNLFVGAPSGTTVTKAANGYNYVFGWANASNPGFYLIGDHSATLGAGKAYLHTTTALATGPDARAGFIFEDEEGGTTAIAGIETKKNMENMKFYNLNGQQVEAPSKGLYIVNGKKVVIK